MEDQTIPEFFSGRSVLVTGATGFMGKVLIEKLLRSCPEIEKIYFIIRNKLGKTIDQRMDEMKSLMVFDRVLKETPNAFDTKLVPMKGDMILPKLGLSEENYKILSENVSIIFHVAATIRFNENLVDAVQMNTLGTREVVNLAFNMPKLVAFLHVSTAYCNCDRKNVGEIVYPPHGDWRKTISIVENIDPAMINILSQKYIGNLPNTYTFTKSLAEQIVWEQREKLPVVIFRPSIVISSWKEPVVGWLDNLNGPTGIMIGYGKGVIRTTLCDTSVLPDYMAVDVAIKAIIIATWCRVKYRTKEFQRHIYNASSTQKSVPINEMIKMASVLADEEPLLETVWKYSTHTTSSKTWFVVNVWLKHVLPAIVIDSFLKLSGRKPMLLVIQRKFYMAMMALCYFTLQSWKFDNENFLSLNKTLLPEDKLDFNFDFEDIVPTEYFKGCMQGAKKYLLKEPDYLRTAAKIRAKRLHYLDMFVKIMFYSVLVWLFFYYAVPQRFNNIICKFCSMFLDI